MEPNMTTNSQLAIHGGPKSVPDGLKKSWPEITPEDKAAVLAVLERKVLSGVHGPEAVGLEAEWAQYTGSKHVLSFNSGTAAIHSALFALGIGPGDEVITSAFSFSGSFHPILEQNAIPIFADIDERTYNVDVAEVEAKITERTKALLPVHIHGLPADMEPLLALGKKHGIPVVEDACQAHGATYHGQKAGTLGAIGCFSLNVTKNLSGGEGGFLNTDDEQLAERAKMIRTFGEQVGKEKEKIRPYYSHTVGWNYRTQELPAAFARSQLKRLDHYNAISQRNGEYLTRELANVPGILPPYVPPDRTSIYHKYRIRFDPKAWNLRGSPVEIRNALLAALEAEGVAATLWHVTPLTSFPVFQTREGYGKGCPWSCPFYGKEVRYDPGDYPRAQHLLDTSLVVNDEAFPIYNQDIELMGYYVQAIRKVVNCIDEIL
jgi:perosamine synthetase